MASNSQLCGNKATNKRLACPYARKFSGQLLNNAHYSCWDERERHQLCDKCAWRDKCPVCGANKAIPERDAGLVT
eukprot:Em0003g625a